MMTAMTTNERWRWFRLGMNIGAVAGLAAALMAERKLFALSITILIGASLGAIVDVARLARSKLER